MDIKFPVVVFDAADLEPESAFWAGVFGGKICADDGWHMVVVDGIPKVGVQFAPDHVAPNWPKGYPPQQVHLDLWVSDFPTAHKEVMTLGATLLQEASGGDDGDDFQIYADPAGHPFCLCWVVGDKSNRAAEEVA